MRAPLVALALAAALAPGSAAAERWLSAEIQGPAPDRLAAVPYLAEGTSSIAAAPTRITGQFVGAVDDLGAALAWVDRALFPGPPLPWGPNAVAEPAAPAPGARLLDEFGLHLLAVAVHEPGADGGAVALRWPTQTPPLPERWRPAALVASRAPLFAAPSPTLPPADERHAVVLRRHDLWALGAVDRCAGADAQRRCLRWLQVIARDGDRFVGGYLPASHVTLQDAWVRHKSGLPRAHLTPHAIRGSEALFVVHARTRDQLLHRVTVALPAIDGGFPALNFTIEGDEAVLTPPAGEPARVRLDPAMDARPRG